MFGTSTSTCPVRVPEVGHEDLLAALHAAAEERGWTALEARVLPGNDRVVRMLRAAFPGTTACWDGDAVVLACPVGLPEIGPEDLLAALVS